MGDQLLSKSEFIGFYRHYSAATEEEKLFESILINCFKLTQDNPVTNSFAGMAGGRKNYETFHRASYLQDHHKHLYYGGTVTSNAPYGTFDEKMDYATIVRPGTKGSEYDYNNGQKPAGNPSSLLREVQTSNNYYSAEEAFLAFRKKIQARGLNGLLQFKRSLLNKGVQFFNIDDFTEFVDELRTNMPKNVVYKIFSALKRESEENVDIVELWKRVLGAVNTARTDKVYEVFDSLDKNLDGFVLLDELKSKFNARLHPDCKKDNKSEDEVYTDFIDSFETHLVLMV